MAALGKMHYFMRFVILLGSVFGQTLRFECLTKNDSKLDYLKVFQWFLGAPKAFNQKNTAKQCYISVELISKLIVIIVNVLRPSELPLSNMGKSICVNFYIVSSTVISHFISKSCYIAFRYLFCIFQVLRASWKYWRRLKENSEYFWNASHYWFLL